MTRVSVESVRNLQVRVIAEDHTWIADEPAGVGDGRGPGPYDLLLAALGSCMTMTLLMYASRKEWSLERVEVEIEHDRVHADDAVNAEQAGAMVDRFRIDLVLHGDLDEVQRDRLAYISARCPVRKTLTGTNVFDESVRLAR
ncbi:MAG: OsmC family protein [Planctomycetota bacterium]|nr:OsmC family protein [Planctomycetota bacterium]